MRQVSRYFRNVDFVTRRTAISLIVECFRVCVYVCVMFRAYNTRTLNLVSLKINKFHITCNIHMCGHGRLWRPFFSWPYTVWYTPAGRGRVSKRDVSRSRTTCWGRFSGPLDSRTRVIPGRQLSHRFYFQHAKLQTTSFVGRRGTTGLMGHVIISWW